jgi:acyl carrier protein
MTDRTRIRDIILQEIARFLAEEGEPRVHLTEDDWLFDSGLDSLGFALLVTRLEEALGYDPFLAIEDEMFPRTVRELVDVYAAGAGAAAAEQGR